MVAPVTLKRASQISRIADLTSKLVKIRSGESPYPKGEIEIARQIVAHLDAEGRGLVTAAIPIEVGRDDRELAFAFLRRSDAPETLVLFGHTDTVGFDGYGKLDSVAIEPEKLQVELIKEGKEKEAIADLKTGDWLCGRGSFDMKSGLAVEMDVLSRLSQDEHFKGNVIFMGTPDEENNSAGIFKGVRYLNEFAAREHLKIIGAVNADYTTSRFPGDNNRYLYIGTIGKLLPTFYVVGKETHVGEIFSGLDANLINAELVRLISLSPDLLDQAEGEVALPPASLKAEDLRTGYSVQTTYAAWSYFNVFTHSRTPEEIMALMMNKAHQAAKNVRGLFLGAYDEYARQSGLVSAKTEVPNVNVYTFQQLAEAVLKTGTKIEDISFRPAKKNPDRVNTKRLVEKMWKMAGLPGPAIVVLLSPPYYPHSFISEEEVQGNRFVRNAAEIARANGLVPRKFYPYIGDSSYWRIAGAIPDLAKYMPLWENGYQIPLEDIRRLDAPVLTLGPWGMDAHKRTERVQKSYSFGILPQIMEDVIRETFRK